MSRPMPRLFVIRHGETEWSLNGRHTGRSDIPLTARGEQQIAEKAEILVGEGKVLDPKNLCTVFVSPRKRAHKTFHLLFAHVETPHHLITEECREWDYGDYEGLLSSEIKAINPTWSIWNDGCPGGESVQEMQDRIDRIITKVREYHRQYKEEGLHTRDVVIVAHGHFSRVLISRWINFPLALGTHFNVEPGGVAYLGYNHNSLSEPALNALNLHATVT
ncbi:histidine phosphatase superfamily [Mycena albidolilacea]|uniref:Histidine phosphatase superfamily n=1 Tax=Mycena albidolilacea TaxID=1033008 RepID=A0AAD7AFM1_9AGAR|nr:histidine phosphatase superfamily [Mycena albidolilacea]